MSAWALATQTGDDGGGSGGGGGGDRRGRPQAREAGADRRRATRSRRSSWAPTPRRTGSPTAARWPTSATRRSTRSTAATSASSRASGDASDGSRPRPRSTRARRSRSSTTASIYISTGADDVFAVDVETGEILWQYKANLDQTITTVCCGWTSRGVAHRRRQGLHRPARRQPRRARPEDRQGRLVDAGRATGKRATRSPRAPLYYDGLVYHGHRRAASSASAAA